MSRRRVISGLPTTIRYVANTACHLRIAHLPLVKYPLRRGHPTLMNVTGTLYVQEVEHPTSPFGRTGAPAQPSAVGLGEKRPLAHDATLHAGISNDTTSRLPTALELRAELLAAREVTTRRCVSLR